MGDVRERERERAAKTPLTAVEHLATFLIHAQIS
jgi:hypothetical protein